MLVASWVTCAILFFLLYCYLYCKLIGYSFRKKVFICFAFSIIFSIFYVLVNRNELAYIKTFMKPFLIHLYVVFCLMFVYKEKFLKTLIVVLCIFVLMCISEFIYDMCVIFIFKVNIIKIVSTWNGYFLSNMFIYILMYLLSRLLLVKKFIYVIINWFNKNEYKMVPICIFMCMFIFTFILYYNFLEIVSNQFLFLVNIFSISIVFFIINYFKVKAHNNLIINEYDQLLRYVQKYEKIVEDKSKAQHEYKNQLILLKGLIKNNKKAIKYIDDLNNELEENKNIELLKKLKFLPNGGLKGLIYYKIDEMHEKGINYYVNFSSEIKNMDLDNELNKNLKDIGKVLGVYIDNAIESCCISKEKFLIIEAYIDENQLVFSISNTYINNFDISKVDNEGYTTKGDGKGFGLSLVKDILAHNDSLSVKKELNGIYFVQKLYIKK